MKRNLLATVMLVSFAMLASVSNAGIVPKFGFKDKIPQYYAVQQVMSKPAALSTTGIVGNKTITSINYTEVTFNLDVARKLTIKMGGTSANVAANTTTDRTVLGKIIYNSALSATVLSASYYVWGTDVNGKAIYESIPVIENSTNTTFTTTRAFKAGTIHFAKQDGADVTANIGFTDAMGLKYAIEHPIDVISAFADTTIEGTRPTITTGNTVAECTLDPNSAANGSLTFRILYLTKKIK